MRNVITNKYGPNTTVLLPGGCDAACDFCFWDRENGKIRPNPDYLDQVFDILKYMPAEFSVLSISGGEPTISPWFGRFLTRLSQFRRERRYRRVVLTTHGGNLLPYITAVGCAIDHINISRHGIGTDSNLNIFKSKNIPTDDELSLIIQKIHAETTCDVTLNCVIPSDVTLDFCHQFISYAKDLGADAVSFRKVASDVSPTKTENDFRYLYGVKSETKCTVCRGMEQSVQGFTVRWKGSVLEPSHETDGIYEAVIHPDGKLYADWSRKLPIEVIKTPTINKSSQKIYEYFGGGCGSGNRGCGGGC